MLKNENFELLKDLYFDLLDLDNRKLDHYKSANEY